VHAGFLPVPRFESVNMADKTNVPEAAPVAPVGKRGRLGTFRALHNRDYRYLWLGQLGHAAALWMEQVLRPVLMLFLTGSAVQVGGIVSARMVPQLTLGLLAGAMADRYNKRRILIVTQTITMIMHLVLGLLFISGRIEVWHIYATAVVSGSSNAFTQPARQSIVPRLVPRKDLLNALALNTAAMNVMRIGGASLAGLLLVFFDFGEVYLLNAAIYVGVMWTTFKLHVPEARPMEENRGPFDEAIPPRRRRRARSSSLFKDLIEGFRYMRENPTVLWLILIALILFVFGQPYQQVFIPLIALEVLHADRSLVGILIAVTGVGALAGSLTVASLEHIPRRGIVMVGALAVFALSLIGLAQSPWLWLSMLMLIIAGATTVTYLSLNNALLLERTPEDLHGRVLSFMSLDRGLMSVGALLAGVLAEVFGAAFGLTIMAGIAGTLAVLALLFIPAIRRMD